MLRGARRARGVFIVYACLTNVLPPPRVTYPHCSAKSVPHEQRHEKPAVTGVSLFSSHSGAPGLAMQVRQRRRVASSTYISELLRNGDDRRLTWFADVIREVENACDVGS
jgi:hypothetical protein